ncbi:MAG: acyltransferase family protein [Sphingobacteriaceae bacterium]
MNENLTNSNSRLLSLDVFRGLTVAAMILVNNPGDWGNIYSPFKHAEWHGCTPTDLIFPFFLFIVGVSIVFALSTKKAKGVSGKEIIISIIKRSAILFLLGIILALFPNVFIDPLKTISGLRIPGVLQRIALVFLVSAIIFYKTDIKTQIILFVILLLGYWALMTLVPVPGVGAPNLEKETNLGAWLDRNILTEAHLWKSAKTWDPEGILSTLPAIATGLSGIFTGIWLRRKDVQPNKKVIMMVVAGILSVVLGYIWNMWFPLNKALWTSSFVLYTSGLAIIILAIFYWLIDILEYKWFTLPFVVYGVNAITVFFMSGIIAKLMSFIKVNGADGTEVSLKTFLYKSYFVPNFSPLNASLAWALSFVFFWFLILLWMYRRKIFIKV